MPRPHEMRLLERAQPPSPPPSGVLQLYLKEWGADVICLQETLLTGMDHRIWSNLRWVAGVASMRQCHGVLRWSYAGVKGDLIRQSSRMARRT